MTCWRAGAPQRRPSQVRPRPGAAAGRLQLRMPTTFNRPGVRALPSILAVSEALNTRAFDSSPSPPLVHSAGAKRGALAATLLWCTRFAGVDAGCVVPIAELLSLPGLRRPVTVITQQEVTSEELGADGAMEVTIPDRPFSPAPDCTLYRPVSVSP